jgi:hypothetical protein
MTDYLSQCEQQLGSMNGRGDVVNKTITVIHNSCVPRLSHQIGAARLGHQIPPPPSPVGCVFGHETLVASLTNLMTQSCSTSGEVKFNWRSGGL